MTGVAGTAGSSVFHTLENLIAPGMRARLSPYVESAQLSVLFGEMPDEQRRAESTRDIVYRNRARVAQLARHWSAFAERKDFAGNDYGSPDFLDAYLAYYFSVNVAKVQLVLLDLVRAGEITGALRVFDVGVGTGTSAVAVLDFLLAWSQVCDLYGEPFPIETVELLGMDRSPQALSWAERVVRAYAEALGSRIGPESVDDPLLRVQDWAAGAQWIVGDVAETPEVARQLGPSLVVASNVWNELDEPSQRSFERMLTAVSPAVAVLIEPGDQKSARALMRWRGQFLRANDGWVSLGPCGQEMGRDLPVVCDNCWHLRREAFHPTALYGSFRDASASLVGDGRSFDDFENRLLSWSYTVLGARPNSETRTSEPESLDHMVALGRPLTARYIGAYVQGARPVAYHPDQFAARGDAQPSEYLKLCPAAFREQKLAFRRHPGFQIPRLRHGDVVQLSNVVVDRGLKIAPCLVPVEAERGRQTRVAPACDPLPGGGFVGGYSDRTRHAVDELGHRLFGFARMHGFQHEILECSLAGRNVLGIAATGGGKSECFILPAILLPGLTIVVSPLKSLMHDQYFQRISKRYGLDHLATFINGDVPFHEREARLGRMEKGCYKMVYVTPEQLERGYVLDSLQRADDAVGLRFLAVDEAHCISQWGHDFRPSYLNILRRLTERGRALQPVVIALTATASPPVRADICEELELDPRTLDSGGDVLVHSANRPELSLVVRVARTTDDKAEGIVDALRRLNRFNEGNDYPGAALIFMPYTGGHPDRVTPQKASQRSTGVSRFSSYLEQTLGARVSIYHGQMDSDDGAGTGGAADSVLRGSGGVSRAEEGRELGDMGGRTREGEQERFIQGATQVMVATKGFGMGVDKPNIRYVVHRSPPGNLEAYAQEAGRAGRDGEPATAILYYSPDSPADDNGFGRIFVSPSDHTIQERFLKDKYVRPVDIAALWRFLRQVSRSLTVGEGSEQTRATSVYFTNDEVIGFFDGLVEDQAPGGLGFKWPDFPPREGRDSEWGEHQIILDRGHLYESKTAYVARILAVAYRIRPELPGTGRVALARTVQETGARVRDPVLRDWEGMLRSNAYFGSVLRDSGIERPEFESLLCQPDLLPLAERLGLPLRELAAMLSDIKFCATESEGGRVSGLLLDFQWVEAPKYGPAEGCDSLAEWRDYAGAQSRAYKPEAEERAHRKGRKWPELDDYFWWHELPQQKGWEVQLDERLPAERFQDYLDAFSMMMADRERTDWESYRRLLTAYIGVTEDGSADGWTGPTQCLRAVMLGYLKSNEVIVGGNCLSCNSCVPEGELDSYSVEQRREVVVRMSPEAEALFGRVEPMAGALPQDDLLASLLAEIADESARGRSLDRYLDGWSARLLEDEPEHKAALLVRLQAMQSQIIAPQPVEIGLLAARLCRLIGVSDVPAVWSVLSELHELAPQESAVHLAQMACRQVAGDVPGEIAVIERILDLARSGALALPDAERRGVWSRVRELCSPDGPGPSGELFDEATIGLARMADSVAVATGLYAEAFGSAALDPSELNSVVEEIAAVEDLAGGIVAFPVLGVLGAWVEVGSPVDSLMRTQQVVALLGERIEQLHSQSVNAGDVVRFASSLAIAEVKCEPRLGVWLGTALVQAHGHTTGQSEAGVRLVVRALADGADVGDTVMRHLVSLVGASEPAADAMRATVWEEGLNRVEVDRTLLRIADVLHVDSWAAVGRWIAVLEDERAPAWPGDAVLGLVRAVGDWCATSPRGIPQMLADGFGQGLVDRVQRLVVAGEASSAAATDAHRQWAESLAQDPARLAEYVSLCLDDDRMPDEAVDQVFERLVRCREATVVVVLLRGLKYREPDSVSRVVAHSAVLVESLRAHARTRGSRFWTEPAPEDVTNLWLMVAPEQSEDRADVLAGALRVLRSRWNKNWLTPVASELEALVLGRRFVEARELAEAYPGLAVGRERESALELVERAEAWGRPRGAPPEAETYQTVTELMIQELRGSDERGGAKGGLEGGGVFSRAYGSASKLIRSTTKDRRPAQ